MHLFTALFLGILEGLTEFLPVSSTGHLLLFEHILPRQSDLFNVVIQSGAVLAILFVFAERLWNLAKNWRAPETRIFLGKLGLAFLITAIGGLALQKLHFTLPESVLPVALATFFGGIAIFWIEGKVRGQRKKFGEVTWRIALLIGVAQLLAAIFPGLSRSGATILMALLFGAGRREATEFSFLLGVPTLLAAGALKILTAWQLHEAVDWKALGVGTVAAMITAFLVVRWFLRFVQSHTFRVFGWYRIGLGAVLLLLLVL